MSSNQQKLEAALHVFRHGFAPQFSADNLESLAEVIRCSPCRIIQRAPVECVANAHNLRSKPLRMSVIGFLVAQNVETVGELWDGFAEPLYSPPSRQSSDCPPRRRP